VRFQVAQVSLESNLLKWSVKQYYLKSLLSYLVLASNQLGVTVDEVRDKRAEYCSLDPTFESTREDNLIMGCVEAIDEGDPEKFATCKTVTGFLTALVYGSRVHHGCSALFLGSRPSTNATLMVLITV
jgi:hypothetical protein